MLWGQIKLGSFMFRIRSISVIFIPWFTPGNLVRFMQCQMSGLIELVWSRKVFGEERRKYGRGSGTWIGAESARNASALSMEWGWRSLQEKRKMRERKQVILFNSELCSNL